MSQHSSQADGLILSPGIVPSASNQKFDERLVSAARRLGVLGQLEPAYQLTQRLFDRIKSLDVVQDPEIPDETRLVFTVEATGSVEEIVDRHGDWCRQLCQLAVPAAECFCLSIDVRS